jgi:hypothetical protein
MRRFAQLERVRPLHLARFTWKETRGMAPNPKVRNGTTHRRAIATLDGTAVETAVFIPDRFHITPGVDLILYYYGMTRHYGSSDLDHYISQDDFSKVFDAVGSDGRFALAFPWLGNSPNSAGIQEHITKSAQHFEAYLSAVIDVVLANGFRMPGFIGPVESLRRLILAGHSAGGVSLRRTIALHSKFSNKVVSAWCLDCFYGIRTSDWIAWKKTKPERSIFCYYTINRDDPANSTHDESEKLRDALKGQKNVEVQPAKAGHHRIPSYYFPKLLARTP